MALVLKDRVKEQTTTTGTGTITLGGTVSGFESFASVGDGNTTYYAIVNPSADEWEVGLGTYTAAGTLLSRDTILESSNSDAAVNFSAGTKDVFVTYPSDKAVYADAAGEVSVTRATSATFATSATEAATALFATSATNATTAVSATNATSATFATSATRATSATFATSATEAATAIFATSATNATTAVSATNATSATFATSATNATNAVNLAGGTVSATTGTFSTSLKVGGTSPDKQFEITQSARAAITTLTDAASISIDFDTAQNFSVTLAGNRTLESPSNIDPGQTGSIFVIQDTTGGRTLSFGSVWKFAGGTAPTLSTGTSATDRIDYVVQTSVAIHAVASLNVT